MHPEEIKAAIRLRDTTCAQIAEDLGVGKPTVSRVISGNAESARIKSYIAAIICKPINEIWPQKPKLKRSFRHLLDN